MNYFQTAEERPDIAQLGGFDRNLTPRELLLGGLSGRSYVHRCPDEGEEWATDGRIATGQPTNAPCRPRYCFVVRVANF